MGASWPWAGTRGNVSLSQQAALGSFARWLRFPRSARAEGVKVPGLLKFGNHMPLSSYSIGPHKTGSAQVQRVVNLTLLLMNEMVEYCDASCIYDTVIRRAHLLDSYLVPSARYYLCSQRGRDTYIAPGCQAQGGCPGTLCGRRAERVQPQLLLPTTRRGSAIIPRRDMLPGISRSCRRHSQESEEEFLLRRTNNVLPCRGV